MMHSGGGGKSFVNSSSGSNLGFFNSNDGVAAVELVDGFGLSLTLFLLLLLLVVVVLLLLQLLVTVLLDDELIIVIFVDDFPLVDDTDTLSDLDDVGMGATIPEINKIQITYFQSYELCKFNFYIPNASAKLVPID